MTQRRSTVTSFILDNSLLLLAGTAVAVVWANVDVSSYDALAHPLHFGVNDVGMVFFFALAAKEVFEATLPGGPAGFARPRASPLAAAVGGMVGPALIYLPPRVGLAGPRTWSADGRFPARPTSRSRRWWRASSFRRPIRPSRSCCCWRLPTTHLGW